MNLLKNNRNYIFRIIIVITIIITILVLFYTIRNNLDTKKDNNYKEQEEKNNEQMIEKIIINDIDGNGTNYEFIYNNEIFKVTYTYDNWKIYNSYKIRNQNDIKKICQALIDIHPIHGKDMVSYRTATDMAYEWLQHNIAYDILPSNNKWRENAKDVDLDPNDQGKNLKEIYEDRTGQKLDIESIINNRGIN